MTSGINLFIAQLDKRIDDAFLWNEFEKFGALFDAAVARDENGESKGFGFVNFCSSKDGLNAMKEMDGKTLFKRAISIQLSNKQKEGSCNDGNTAKWADDWNPKFSVKIPGNRLDTADDQSQISDATVDSGSPGNWDIKERMKRLFESQMYTDVTFYPKNNRNMSISAHRAVLAIGSPLFQTMLFGDANKETAGMKMEVQISNLSFDAFTNIVKYIYTDEVFFESDAIVQGIFEGAKQFKIHRLMTLCKQYFESLELTEQNVCSKLQLSITNKIDPLKERCIEFIQRNTHGVINSTDFQSITPTTMRAICKLSSFNLHNEKELLDAVMKWLYANPPQSRKQMMEPLLKCMRFLTFTVSEMGDTLKQYPDLLKADDSLSIMLYLYNPPKTPNFQTLPSWLNKNTSKRCVFSEISREKETEVNATAPNNRYLPGKVCFPLQSQPVQYTVTDLASLLQMKCISGMHEIRAIKLMFQKPQNTRSVIETLTIKVHIHPCSFDTHEIVHTINSETVRVDFRKPVKTRRGDLIDIEVEAKNIKFYKFLKFDDAVKIPSNPHFQCVVASRPKLDGKLYFISELEYGPQMINGQRKRRPPEKGVQKQRSMFNLC